MNIKRICSGKNHWGLWTSNIKTVSLNKPSGIKDHINCQTVNNAKTFPSKDCL